MRSSSLIIIGILCLFTMVAAADAAASTVSVMGTVTDANGNPVQGASLTMVDNNYKQVARTLSDANGNFEFVAVEPGTSTFKVLTSYSDGNKTYTAPAEYALWHASSGTQYVSANETQLLDYVLPPFSAKGTVTDASGAPLEGARVMLIDSNNKEVQAARSDANGSYEFVGVPKTAENFTVSVLFIKDNQSYKASSPGQYPESGVQPVGTIRISGYVPSAVSQQATVQTTVLAPSAAPPVDTTALAIALLLGILALACAFLLLRKMT